MRDDDVTARFAMKPKMKKWIADSQHIRAWTDAMRSPSLAWRIRESVVR